MTAAEAFTAVAFKPSWRDAHAEAQHALSLAIRIVAKRLPDKMTS